MVCLSTFPLRLLPGDFVVCRLPPGAAIPRWADGKGLVSITRTGEELSIVCDAARVPGTVKAEPGWRAIQLVGPVPFATVGVLARLTAPLAAARVGVFVVSTFDTDYLLVKAVDLDRATAALKAAGWPFEA